MKSVRHKLRPQLPRDASLLWRTCKLLLLLMTEIAQINKLLWLHIPCVHGSHTLPGFATLHNHSCRSGWCQAEADPHASISVM